MIDPAVIGVEMVLPVLTVLRLTFTMVWLNCWFEAAEMKSRVIAVLAFPTMAS